MARFVPPTVMSSREKSWKWPKKKAMFISTKRLLTGELLKLEIKKSNRYFFLRSTEKAESERRAEEERQEKLHKDKSVSSMSPEMREGPSSTPEFRQDLGEGLLELDEGQLQGEGAGRAGVPLGVSGTLAMAEAPVSCSTAPSPLPLSTSSDKMEESGDDFAMDQDVNWNDQVLVPVLKTPSKNQASLTRTRRTPETTPSSSSLSTSTASPAKKARLLPSPSPGKRWLQTREAGGVPEPQLKTVEEMAEMIVCSEICPEQPKVCKRKILRNLELYTFH